MKAITLITTLVTAVLISGTSLANINKNYYLRGEPQVGTKLPTVEAVSKVPFNKSFKELSSEEQTLFKSKFEKLGQLDTPPFPQKGLKEIYKPVVKANRTIRASGKLRATANVNELGVVESVNIISSPNKKLSNIAKKALLKTKFDAAQCNGANCSMEFPFEITLL